MNHQPLSVAINLAAALRTACSTRQYVYDWRVVPGQRVQDVVQLQVRSQSTLATGRDKTQRLRHSGFVDEYNPAVHGKITGTRTREQYLSLCPSRNPLRTEKLTFCRNILVPRKDVAFSGHKRLAAWKTELSTVQHRFQRAWHIVCSRR